MGFDCCGVSMGDAMTGCPCTAVMRKHPLIAFLAIALMGLACLAISTGVILGVVAFLRTF